MDTKNKIEAISDDALEKITGGTEDEMPPGNSPVNKGTCPRCGTYYSKGLSAHMKICKG